MQLRKPDNAYLELCERARVLSDERVKLIHKRAKLKSDSQNGCSTVIWIFFIILIAVLLYVFWLNEVELGLMTAILMVLLGVVTVVLVAYASSREALRQIKTVDADITELEKKLSEVVEQIKEYSPATRNSEKDSDSDDNAE